MTPDERDDALGFIGRLTEQGLRIDGWISVDDGFPDFQIYGFHVCEALPVLYEDGSEGMENYQGWGLWGVSNRSDITHWKKPQS